MKNYVAVYAVPVTTSALAPKTIAGISAEQAQVLTDQYLALDPGSTQDGPPIRLYWLLNKRVISEIFLAFPDSFVSPPLPSNPQFTEDTDVAKNYNVESELEGLGAWGGTDTADPQQVKAAKIADKRDKAPKTKVVKTESLLDALRTFAGALVAASFSKDPLLKQLATFIGKVAAGLPYDAAALGLLLQRIENTLTR
jgi:hypothetical protein